MDIDYSKLDINDLIELLVKDIVQCVTESWDELVLHALIEEDDNGELKGTYYSKGEKDVKYFQTTVEQYMMLDTMREKMKNDKQSTWTNATITIQPTGSFDIDYKYQD